MDRKTSTVLALILLLFVKNFFSCRKNETSSEKKKIEKSGSHYGFQFLDKYEDALKTVRKRFGEDSIREKKSEFLIEGKNRLRSPEIVFTAPYFGFLSINTLDFTPSSKRLIRIDYRIAVNSRREFADTFNFFYAKFIEEYGSVTDLSDPPITSLKSGNYLWSISVIKKWETENYRIALLGSYHNVPCTKVTAYSNIGEVPLDPPWLICPAPVSEVRILIAHKDGMSLEQKERLQILDSQQ